MITLGNRPLVNTPVTAVEPTYNRQLVATVKHRAAIRDASQKQLDAFAKKDGIVKETLFTEMTVTKKGNKDVYALFMNFQEQKDIDAAAKAVAAAPAESKKMDQNVFSDAVESQAVKA